MCLLVTTIVSSCSSLLVDESLRRTVCLLEVVSIQWIPLCFSARSKFWAPPVYFWFMRRPWIGFADPHFVGGLVWTIFEPEVGSSDHLWCHWPVDPPRSMDAHSAGAEDGVFLWTWVGRWLVWEPFSKILKGRINNKQRNVYHWGNYHSN